ncbi:hypothetical protein BDP27DRAFT_1370792 [Rhodocollybia butyracea]|uniref:Uncharacterized protein n=1 Tax=Rhodocollybia butyracea TaxID=206335 RepID=A0A9P5PB65_9AGAR|nr:hypothetical protein BDP27DRAFT_1370792 [Rhodocollybia butyracea]
MCRLAYVQHGLKQWQVLSPLISPGLVTNFMTSADGYTTCASSTHATSDTYLSWISNITIESTLNCPLQAPDTSYGSWIQIGVVGNALYLIASNLADILLVCVPQKILIQTSQNNQMQCLTAIIVESGVMLPISLLTVAVIAMVLHIDPDTLMPVLAQVMGIVQGIAPTLMLNTQPQNMGQ